VVNGRMSGLLCRRAELPDPRPLRVRQRRRRPSRRISAPSLPRSAARQSGVMAMVATWTRQSSLKAARSTADGRQKRSCQHNGAAGRMRVLTCQRLPRVGLSKICRILPHPASRIRLVFLGWIGGGAPLVLPSSLPRRLGREGLRSMIMLRPKWLSLRQLTYRWRRASTADHP